MVQTYSFPRVTSLGTNRGAISLLIGLFFGFFFVGWEHVNPINTSWLMNAWSGDAAQNQLSFEFFMRAPLLQWPLTATPDNIAGSSQVIASGNGFSIIAKLLLWFSDAKLQFSGIWIVCLFGLQGFFSERLLSRYLNSTLAPILGAVFFILAPAFLYRIALAHYELAAHFLIIWFLDLAARNERRRMPWALLLSMTMFINLYIWVMVAFLFAAYLVQQFSNFRFRELLRLAALPGAFSVILFFVMGYGTYRSSAKGSGVFRANAVTFLNPKFEESMSWSYLGDLIRPIANRPFSSMEGEGFNFLGLGILILIFIMTVRLLTKSASIIVPSRAVLMASIILFLFSLSNNIVIVRREINVWWPDVVVRFQEVFRGAARFSWPLYYLCYLIAIVGVCRALKHRKVISVLVVLLVLNFADAARAVETVRQRTFGEIRVSKLLSSDRWASLASGKEKLELVPTFDMKTDNLPSELDLPITYVFGFGRFALENHLSTNFGSIPRSMAEYAAERNFANRQDLFSGELDPTTLYVLIYREEFDRLKDNLSGTAEFTEIDGFYIISAKSS